MKNKKLRKFLKWATFFVYIALLVYVMFFAEMLGRTDTVTAYRYNLVPFREIKRFFRYYKQLGFLTVLANIGGNIVAFLPFGYCLPLVSEHKIKFFSATMYTFTLSLCIEFIQLISKVGSCDVDDLILNTLGGILGYLAFLIYKHMAHRKKDSHEII